MNKFYIFMSFRARLWFIVICFRWFCVFFTVALTILVIIDIKIHCFWVMIRRWLARNFIFLLLVYSFHWLTDSQAIVQSINI